MSPLHVIEDKKQCYSSKTRSTISDSNMN